MVKFFLFMPHSSTLAPSTQPSTLAFNGTPNVTPIVEALNATPNATPNGNATHIVEALNVEALNVEALNVEALNDRALDVYTLFLFQFIKNFASQVALGGSKFAYLCGHIT